MAGQKTIPVISITSHQDREASEETENLLNEVNAFVDGENTEGRETDDSAMDAQESGEDTINDLCDQVKKLGEPGSGEPGGVQEVFRYEYIVMSDRCPPEVSFEYEGVEIKWMHVDKLTVADTQVEIMRLLDDAAPKNIIVWCYNKFILNKDSTNEVMESIKLVRNKAKDNTRHSVALADCLFVPELESRWKDISVFNFYVRNINMSMSRTPLSPSKGFLKKVKHLTKLAVKGTCWLEHENNTGLGTNLSEEGWNKIRRWFGAHMLSGMQELNTRTLPGKQEWPAPLYLTPGYKGSVMVNCLISKGTYRYPDSPSVKRARAELARLIGNDILHPNLSSIHRRFSTSSSGSSSSRRSSGSGRLPYNRQPSVSERQTSPRYSRQPSVSERQESPRYNEAEVKEKLQVSKLERDIADLIKEIEVLKESREREVEKRRVIEDRLYSRLDRLGSEMEWQARDRRSLESKVAKLKDDLRYLKEARDEYRSELEKERRKK